MKRRAAGTGTIVGRGAKFMARLPDRDRTSLGVFGSYVEAERILDAAVGELRDGKIATGKSLAAYGRSVLDDREREGYRAVDSERSRWTAYVESWECGNWPPSVVQPMHVLEWVRGLRSRKLATQTIRNALTLLRSVFASAFADGLVPSNPCADVEVRDHGRSDDTQHMLTLPELDALMWCADAEARPLIAVAAGCGIRQGEQRSLRWEDVHLEGDSPHLTIRYGAPNKPPKNGRVRVVALFGLALAAMRSLRRRTGLVWPTSEGHARWQGKIVDRKRWAAWLAAAGISRPVRWHDLRHTCATLLLVGAWGTVWTTEEVRELLGHSSVAVTERYARPNGALAERAARRHREGTEARSAGNEAARLAAKILEEERSRLRDLNSRPTVYEFRGSASVDATLEAVRALAVRLLERAATVGDVSREGVRLAGQILDELDRAVERVA